MRVAADRYACTICPTTNFLLSSSLVYHWFLVASACRYQLLYRKVYLAYFTLTLVDGVLLQMSSLLEKHYLTLSLTVSRSHWGGRRSTDCSLEVRALLLQRTWSRLSLHCLCFCTVCWCMTLLIFSLFLRTNLTPLVFLWKWCCSTHQFYFALWLAFPLYFIELFLLATYLRHLET